METIGVRELRQHASKYLARVEAGEELAVTNNGRLVARLTPVAATARTREALISAGVLTAAKSPRAITALAARTLTGRSLSEILGEMRGAR